MGQNINRCKFSRRKFIGKVGTLSVSLTLASPGISKELEDFDTLQSSAATTKQSINFLSPEILKDNKVTFRFYAPNAKEVLLTGDCWKIQGHSMQMEKDSMGLWSLTIGPLTPDIYSYSFIVDGIRVLDQDNGWVKPGVSITENMFLVEGKEAEFLMESSVPHGEIRIVHYQSLVLEKTKRMHIYFPPEYNTNKEKYPVMYLLHGGGDYDDGWITMGRINLILDNLIAEGKSKPMIVVMPAIWALDPPVPSAKRQENHDLFSKSLSEDIIPFIEQNYRVIIGPENRAIGGLSLPNILPNVFYTHIDKFNYLGCTSTGMGMTSEQYKIYNDRWPSRIDNPANIKRIKIWIGDGINARSFAITKNFAETMKELGYKTTFYETDGIHAWPWFRRYFAEFSKHVFK